MTPLRLERINTYHDGDKRIGDLQQDSKQVVKRAQTVKNVDLSQDFVKGNFVFHNKNDFKKNQEDISSFTLKKFSAQTTQQVTLNSSPDFKKAEEKLEQAEEEDSTNEKIQENADSSKSNNSVNEPDKSGIIRNPIFEDFVEEIDDFGFITIQNDNYQNVLQNFLEIQGYEEEKQQQFIGLVTTQDGTPESEIQITQQKPSDSDIPQIVITEENKTESIALDQQQQNIKKSIFSKSDLQDVKDTLSNNDSSEINDMQSDMVNFGKTAKVFIIPSEQKAQDENSSPTPSILPPKNNIITPAQRRKSLLSQVDTQRFKEGIEKSKNLITPIQRTPRTPLTPVDKLKIAGTVVRTLSRLQVNQVNRIESSDQLDKEMKTLKQNSSFLQDGQKNINEEIKNLTETDIALKSMRMIEQLTLLIERGHPKDLNDVIQILRKDPKQQIYLLAFFLQIVIVIKIIRYVLSSEDPQHILNKLNSKLQNCSYIACKNGNMNIIQFLVRNEVNFNIKSKVGGDIEEYPLQVAARWNHREVIEYLLSQKIVKISQEQIRLASKEAATKELKLLISKYLTKKPFFICC